MNKANGYLLLFLYLTLSLGQISCANQDDVSNQSSADQSTAQKPTPEKTRPSAPKVPTTPPELTPELTRYCQMMDEKFKKYGWGKSSCQEIHWHHVRNSVQGTPLVWKVFGQEDENNKEQKNTTMIICGAHGDEITPVKFCFDILEDLLKHPHHLDPQKDLVVVAPLANPDSFFKERPTRTNARGVDVNRNFPTKDWRKDALRIWRTKFRKDPRRYPGPSPMSEPETLFQVNLILRYRPDKIIQVHSPLSLLDYDGPEDANKSKKSGKAILANELLITMSQKASGYRVQNYPYFVGSLGNWAGKERNIPTYTLELPTSDNRKSNDYWLLFKEAIRQAIQHDFRPQMLAQVEEKLEKEEKRKAKGAELPSGATIKEAGKKLKRKN